MGLANVGNGGVKNSTFKKKQLVLQTGRKCYRNF